MLAFEILSKKLDFGKNNGTCNHPECKNHANFSFLFKEKNLKLKSVKELAEVKLCQEHIDLANKVFTQIEKNKGNYITFEMSKKKL